MSFACDLNANCHNGYFVVVQAKLQAAMSKARASKGGAGKDAPPGRVLVFGRTRPFLAREEGDLPAVHMDSEKNTIVVSSSPDPLSCLQETKEVQMERKEKGYELDGVFDTSATQKEVFQRVGLPVLVEVMKGFNGCIFAYGQTGSGKTFSLLNTEVSDMEEVGILPRLVATLYARAAMDKANVYSVQAAGFQVYNEQVDDLLNPGHKQGQGQNLSIQKGGGIPDLCWIECKTPASMLDAFKKARAGIFYAETKMNKSSSRSHAVFQVRVVRRARVRQGDAAGAASSTKMQATCGQLSVVDLAGSERVKRSGVTGNNFKEATNINGSLLALGNVIQALAEKKAHVPFRDSKLTRILEGSVGGNCKTSLLVCVSPAETSTSETLSTLEFASRAMKVEVCAKVNETVVEIDAARLAADMEDGDGAAYVDEEMMKTFKESEQALSVARAKMADQEKHAETLKARVQQVESVLKEKDESLMQTIKEKQQQLSVIDSLKETLASSEEKHAQELTVAKAVTEKLQAQVSQAKQELSEKQKTLQAITQKHVIEQRARQEAQKRVEMLKREMDVQREKAEQALKASETANVELKRELHAEVQARKQEYEELQSKITKEVSRAQELESSVQTLQTEKAALAATLNSMDADVNQMNTKLNEERAKLEKLSVIQEEAEKLKQELDQVKSKESSLQVRLETIQRERSTLNSQVVDLRSSCTQLRTNYQLETEARQTLEHKRAELIDNLKSTEESLHKEKQYIRELEEKQLRELRELREQQQAELAELDARAKEDARKREQHAAEAMQALELRAQQDHHKMQEKVNALEDSLRAREQSHRETLEQRDRQHATALTQALAKLEEEQRRKVAHMDEQIKRGLENLVAAEKEALEREKALEAQYQAQAARSNAAQAAARAALAATMEKLQEEFEALHSRFVARESRQEDLELIAKQQREISEVKRRLQEAKRTADRKQLELDNFMDNVRIFGTAHDGPGGRHNMSLLPGQKVGDRASFLNRKAKTPKGGSRPRAAGFGSGKRFPDSVKASGAPVANPAGLEPPLQRPHTAAAAGSSNSRTETPTRESPDITREHYAAGRPNNYRNRPLPVPPGQ